MNDTGSPPRPTQIDRVAKVIDDLRSEALHYATLNPTLGGLLFVAEQIIAEQAETIDRHYGNGEIDPVTSRPPKAAKPLKAETTGKRAPKGQGAHRHKFDSEGLCNCGAKRRRAAKGSAGAAPDAEARTVPLPMPMVNSRPLLGDHAPDDFDGGAFGSSGASDRRP